MSTTNPTHYCIICGRGFHPANPEVVFCANCGGPPEAVLQPAVVALPESEVTLLDNISEGTLLDVEPEGTLLDAASEGVPAGRAAADLAADGIPAIWHQGDVILDLYEVRGQLGAGGFGTVYRVHHRTWNLDLAVKTPNAAALQRAGSVEDFISEAESWMDLGLHPHIVTCHYVRTLGGIPRVFAELVEGGSLADWIRDGRLYAGGPDAALARLLNVAIQFAWGLHYAHEQGMIHQDVKPANVLLTAEGTAKVTDFGLARATAAGDSAAGMPGGTRKVQGRGMTYTYCSPEQVAGELLTRRTDLWSWGLSVLELFAGKPFWVTVRDVPTGPLAPEALAHYTTEGAVVAGIPPMPATLMDLLREIFREDPDARPHNLQLVAERLQAIYQQVTGQAYPREQPKATELRADSLNNRALSLVDIGRQEDAATAWEEALRVDAHHPQATYNYGLRRWRSVRMTDHELVGQLLAVITAQPEAWEPRYLLALVHLERDDCQSAIDVLEAIPREDAQRQEVVAVLEQARQRLPDSKRLLRTFEGHTGCVTSVYLSADGRYALSGGKDARLDLWEVATGKCLRTFGRKRMTEVVWSVCLSADGRHALSGSSDRTLYLWNVVTGERLRTFEGHSRAVIAVCMSTDGSTFVSGSDDKTLKLWDLATGQCLRTFEGHTGCVTSVCLSPDGRYALSGSRDHTLRLWDVATGRCLRTFEGHQGEIGSVCLSTSGCTALSGGEDAGLKLWDVTTGQCLRTFGRHENWITSVSLSADEKNALSASESDKMLKLWDVATGRCVRTFEGHGMWVNSVCLSDDGHYGLSGSEDQTLKLWNLATGHHEFSAPVRISMVLAGTAALQQETEFRQLLIRAVERRKQGVFTEAARLVRKARSLPGYERSEEAASAWAALYLHLPHTGFRAGWKVRTFEGHQSAITSVCLSADRSIALSGSKDRTFNLWDVATGKRLRTFEIHEVVWSICMSADGRHAFTGDGDNTLNLWNIGTGECVYTFEGHKDWVNSVCLSPDGRTVLSGSRDRTLKLWDVATGQCLRTFNGHKNHLTSVFFSADGRTALSGSYDKTLKLWDVATGACVRTFAGYEKWVLAVCSSADGRYILSGGGGDKALKLWNAATGECLHTFARNEKWVTSVCLSGDGRYALSGSEDDTTLKLWKVTTGECLCILEGHKMWVNSIDMSSDGRYALSGSEDGALKLWFLDWNLGENDWADWDEGARPYLENFLTLHTPYRAGSLERSDQPSWTELDFQQLLTELGYRGYGWLRPEGVRRKLNELAAERG